MVTLDVWNRGGLSFAVEDIPDIGTWIDLGFPVRFLTRKLYMDPNSPLFSDSVRNLEKRARATQCERDKTITSPMNTKTGGTWRAMGPKLWEDDCIQPGTATRACTFIRQWAERGIVQWADISADICTRTIQRIGIHICN